MSETNPEILAARAKLAAKFGVVQTGGKGSTRRKTRVTHKGSAADDKKLQGYLKRIGAQPIGGVDEVSMFHENGNVTVFTNPKFQAAMAANTFAVSGDNVTRPIEALLPQMMKNLDANQLAMLKKMMAAQQGASDADVPDLVENFE